MVSWCQGNPSEIRWEMIRKKKEGRKEGRKKRKERKEKKKRKKEKKKRKEKKRKNRKKEKTKRGCMILYMNRILASFYFVTFTKCH